MTGFDPAYPCFEDASASLRLRKSDAPFVDVYHTNSEAGENKGNFGIYDLIGNKDTLNTFFMSINLIKASFFKGHVDFYINGGNNQSECIRKDCIGVIECIVDSTRKFLTDHGLTEIVCSTFSFFMKSRTGVETKNIAKKGDFLKTFIISHCITFLSHYK